MHRILTERLELRSFHPDDAPAWRQLLDANDAWLRPWIPFMHDEPLSLEDTSKRLADWRTDFEAGEQIRYAMIERASGTLVGLVCLLDRAGPGALEAGYLVAREHAGRGLASEATRALIREAFERHGVDRVVLVCDPRNAPSNRLARALGFTVESESADAVTYTLPRASMS